MGARLTRPCTARRTMQPPQPGRQPPSSARLRTLVWIHAGSTRSQRGDLWAQPCTADQTSCAGGYPARGSAAGSRGPRRDRTARPSPLIRGNDCYSILSAWHLFLRLQRTDVGGYSHPTCPSQTCLSREHVGTKRWSQTAGEFTWPSSSAFDLMPPRTHRFEAA